jgi:hypothetical protein
MTPPSIGATTRAVIADVGRRASKSAAAAEAINNYVRTLKPNKLISS